MLIWLNICKLGQFLARCMILPLTYTNFDSNTFNVVRNGKISLNMVGLVFSHKIPPIAYDAAVHSRLLASVSSYEGKQQQMFPVNIGTRGIQPITVYFMVIGTLF